VFKKTILIFSLFIFTTVSVLACKFTFIPSTVKVNSNGKATVKISVTCEHRTCQMGCKDITIDCKGVKILKNSGWIETEKKIFQNTLEIQLTETSGTIRVWRECSKHGISENTVKVVK